MLTDKSSQHGHHGASPAASGVAQREANHTGRPVSSAEILGHRTTPSRAVVVTASHNHQYCSGGAAGGLVVQKRAAVLTKSLSEDGILDGRIATFLRQGGGPAREDLDPGPSESELPELAPVEQPQLPRDRLRLFCSRRPQGWRR